MDKKQLFTGALAGCVATAPMSVLMFALHRYWRDERKPLPPYQITMNLAQRLGLKKKLNERERGGVSLASHFGYGAATGVIYPVLAEAIDARVTLPPAIKGTLFGLLVWTLSYLGWLPATGIGPSATDQSSRRVVLMVFAHVVWGAGTGVLFEQWKDTELKAGD